MLMMDEVHHVHGNKKRSYTPQLNFVEITHIDTTFVTFTDFATSCSLVMCRHEL